MSERWFVVLHSNVVVARFSVIKSEADWEGFVLPPTWMETTQEIAQSAIDGYTWNGTNFVAPPIRTIKSTAFADRVPLTTQLALEEIAEGATPEGRLVRVLTRRLQGETTVNLDAPALLQGWVALTPILIAAQVEGWENEAQAASMIASLLMNDGSHHVRLPVASVRATGLASAVDIGV